MLRPRRTPGPADAGLLILRAVAGGLLVGHGTQKLFGWFGGPGIAGMARALESMCLRPGDRWALAAGGGEAGGGLLTALGLLWPLGPITVMAPMGVAIGKAHWGRPIWAQQGGAELPVTNLAIAACLALTGPGRLSLDHLLRLRVRWPLTALAAAGVAGGVAAALYRSRPVPGAAAPQAAPEEAAASSRLAGPLAGEG